MEIKKSKFSVKPDSSGVIGSGRFFWIVKSTEPVLTSIRRYLGFPFSVIARIYAFESRRVGSEHPLVLLVLERGRSAKVTSPVIEGVVIFMVRLLTCFATQNLTMHINPSGEDSFANRTEGVRTHIPSSKPVPLSEPFEVFSIHNRVLAPCQRNKAVRFMKWLGDFVSGYTRFTHESSTEGFVLPSHYNLRRLTS